MIKCLCWNIRGISGAASVRRLKKLCRIHDFSLLIILEPFLSDDRLEEFRVKLGFQHAFHSVTNKICIFSRHNLAISVVRHSEQFLHLECRHPVFSHTFFITALYAKCSVVERRALWSDLLALQQAFQEFPG